MQLNPCTTYLGLQVIPTTIPIISPYSEDSVKWIPLILINNLNMKKNYWNVFAKSSVALGKTDSTTHSAKLKISYDEIWAVKEQTCQCEGQL